MQISLKAPFTILQLAVDLSRHNMLHSKQPRVSAGVWHMRQQIITIQQSGAWESD